MKLSERSTVTGGALGTDQIHIIRSNGDSPETFSSYRVPIDDLPLPSTSQIDFLSGIIADPADQDYRVALNLPYALTITKITTRSASGTCTLTGKINTTALGGAANSVSTSEQAQTHGSSNAASIGDDIVLTISSNSSCVDLSFLIEFTRTLA